MLLKTSGLVIREKVLSNDNRMLTILTGEYGVIKAFIRTSRKMRSSLAAAIDLFSYSDFLIFFNKDQYCVDGAETNRIFYHLREDLKKTSLAAYMGELAETLVPQGEPAQEYLSLMLNCLHLLETDQRTVDFIKPLFELRLLTMAGYMPDLVGCTCCGQYQAEQFYFSHYTGKLLCANCCEQEKPQGYVPLTKDQLAAMRHIVFAQGNRVFRFKMSEAGLYNLGILTEVYLNTHLDKRFPSQEFYDNLRAQTRSLQQSLMKPLLQRPVPQESAEPQTPQAITNEEVK